MVHVVERVAEQVFIPFTVGGGIRSVEDVRRMLRAGADKVSLNTAAVNDPDIVRRGADEFGDQCIVVAIDARRRNADDPERGLGGRDARRPHADRLDAVEWAAHACDLGAGEILLTSMDRDGTKAGYDIDLLQAVGDAVDVPDHRERRRRHPRAPVRRARPRAARRGLLAASIFHFGQHTVREAKAVPGRARGLGRPARERPVRSDVTRS